MFLTFFACILYTSLSIQCSLSCPLRRQLLPVTGHIWKISFLLLQKAAMESIGSHSDAKALELLQTIQRILCLEAQIEAVEAKINPIIDSLQSPIMTVPGISYRTFVS